MIPGRISTLSLLVAALAIQRIASPQELSMANVRGILIEMDSGNLTVKASDVSGIRGNYATPERPLDLAGWAKIEASMLVLRVPQTPATADHLSLVVPKLIGVTVVSHSATIRAEDFESPLTIRTFSGNIEVFNAVGPTSLDSDLGDIAVEVRAQPKADSHIQAGTGTVRCTLDDGISLSARLRSGKRASWGTGAQTTSGTLDRALGRGGPLMSASSRNNNVAVDLVPSQLPAPGSESGVVFRSDTNWVYMNVIVKDPVGRTLADLTQEKFIVTDNGSPVELGHFEKTSEPFHLLLLFDASASIRPHLGIIHTAATQFIQRARKGDQFAVATFSSAPRLIQPFTPDPALVEKALNSIKPSGGTAIYDAVHSAITDYMRGTSGRKAIILFTDGIDNSLFGKDFGSSHSFEGLLRTVKDSDCLIYPIFVQPVPERRQISSRSDAPPTSLAELLAKANGPNPQLLCASETNPSRGVSPCPFDPYQIIAIGKQHLQQLALETGGRFNGLREIGSLIDAYNQVAADLATVYTIGFPVKLIDTNQWHPLKLRIRDMPIGTQTRTRGGYYSPGPR